MEIDQDGNPTSPENLPRGRATGRKKRAIDARKNAATSGKPGVRVNPLLRDETLRFVDVERIAAPCVLVRPSSSGRRELRDLRRRQTAIEAVAGLQPGTELYGFTKGQFSLLDLLQALLEITGPADVVLSTWTAARHEIQSLDGMVKSGVLRSMRWLVDFSFSRRDPAAAYQVRQTFGLDAIRVAQNHAKFALIQNDRWDVVLRTSMNLNMNPRFEDFTVAHDPELAAFLKTIIDEIWSRQRRSLANARPAEARRFFLDQM